MAAGLISLVWLALTEVWLGSRNSWIFLNYENPEMPPWDSSDWGPVFFELRILAAAFTVIAVSCTALRLFPARWVLRGAPLCRRTWPAFAVGFFVLAAWFVHSVTPYSAPGYDHPPHAPMRILHLQKRGLRFYETTVNMFRFGQVWVQRVDRRLFQYRFQARLALSLLDGASPAYHRAQAMIQSPELWKRRTPPPRMMWSWNAEGWYVVLKDSQLLAFTTESGTKPPAEVTDLFHELEKLPTSEERSFAFRDVCLGFCYDPVAALGFSILPQRNRLLSSSTFVRSGF
ncbi:hypothetical protein SBA3_2230048 [Candidatus Sulfopaludibacter sp. SbA3]|nr:hypothetical protein SBA3_2230048 [Candidatus Sulfopaludibacter sp. SbA3]